MLRIRQETVSNHMFERIPDKWDISKKIYSNQDAKKAAIRKIAEKMVRWT